MTTDILSLYQAEGHQAVKKNAKEWAGPCPDCGGNDRFTLFLEQGRDGTGRYWCRGCGAKGDAIDFLRVFKGLGFRDACHCLNITPPSHSSSQKGTGRLTAVQGQSQPRTWALHDTPLPCPQWQSKARKLTAWAEGQLATSKANLAWLRQQRGLTLGTIQRHHLGWIPEPLWRDRHAWGLPPEHKPDGSPRKLWIPSGLAIPVYDDHGQIRRIKIRLADPGMNLPKYLPVANEPKEANTAPLQIFTGADAWAVVESELDALLLAQEAGALVNVAALGSASYRPDASLFARLQAAPFVLCCLDHDDAGYKNTFQWWTGHFPFEQLRPWPVPEGKDICDAWRLGWSLSEWIASGLPPSLGRSRAEHARQEKGGWDIGETCPPAPEQQYQAPKDVEVVVFNERGIPIFGVDFWRFGTLYDIPRADPPCFMEDGPECAYQELREVIDHVEEQSGYRPHLYLDRAREDQDLALIVPLAFDLATLEYAAEKLRHCAGLVRGTVIAPGRGERP